MSIDGYILAGGKSRRFGSDKARAVLDGVALLSRVAATIGPCCERVFVVADVADKYGDLGLTTIVDLRPGLGPLTGLETALSHRLGQQGGGWILLVSCDLAGIERMSIDALLKEVPADESVRSTNAIAFRAGVWQPFPALFHTDLLPLCSALLDGERASFQRLLSDVGSHAREVELPRDWPETPQVNTRDDFERMSLEVQHRSKGGDGAVPRDEVT